MKYIETLNHIKEDIIFTGFIDDLQLTALYKYAVGVAYISFYEGFGLPILEAMAAGKAVISSDTTSMPEVGGEAVLYCNPYSSDSILEAISTLVLDDTKRKEMEKQGALQSKKFSYKKAAQETIELYQKLV